VPTKAGYVFAGRSELFTDISADVTIVATYRSSLMFNLNENGKSFSVTGFDGKDNEVVIPNVYNGLPVTSIGDCAFSGCTSLTSITYAGTKAEWDSISKGSGWNYGTGNYTVHCTDGDINK